MAQLHVPASSGVDTRNSDGSFLREQQPKTIIFWGQDDIFFTREGGEAYLNDLPNAEMHRLNSGHFAVEDCSPTIVDNMKAFYNKVRTA